MGTKTDKREKYLLETRHVKVSRDHLEQQSKASPLAAMCELIWNGLDAGGSGVDVRFEMNKLGTAIAAIEVEDRGTGILPEHVDRAFGTVGNSLKIESRKTPEGRILHGKEGRGRFKALALGTKATWTTTYKNNGTCFRYQVIVPRMSMDDYGLSSPEKVDADHTGTVVRVDGVDHGELSLLADGIRDRIIENFALYLKDYPQTRLVYDNRTINIDSAIVRSDTYELDLEDESPPKSTLTVIEWKFKPENRRLLLCDLDGFALAEVRAGVQAKGFEFTAYLRSNKVREWQQENRLDLSELDPAVSLAINQAREALKSHFRERLAGEAQDMVEQWKKDQIYPYSDEEAQTPVKKAERQVFDIVAVRVNQYHQAFREGDNDAKKLTLHLFKQALESNPGSVQKILKEVLRLPHDLQDELAEILDRTTFQAIIQAAKTVARRLDTIRAFEEILFDDDWRKRLLERTQLHRLLVHELWLLGEEYTLDADDDPLPAVLKKHIQILGRTEPTPEMDVKLITDKDGILDLMLSRKFLRRPNVFEFLVLELKRPKDNLAPEDVQQIENYAFTVSQDDRFSKENTQWTFCLLGNRLGRYAGERVNSEGLPYGCIHKKGNLTIWIKQWSDVLHDAKIRYEFFREKLDMEASCEKGMSYLRDNYQELLTGRGKRKGKEVSQPSTAVPEQGQSPSEVARPFDDGCGQGPQQPVA